METNSALSLSFSHLWPEQRVIAAVLDSIDEVIERTEAVIAATERLRDALLHELLTRGVPGWHSEWKDAPWHRDGAGLLGRGAAGGCGQVAIWRYTSQRTSRLLVRENPLD